MAVINPIQIGDVFGRLTVLSAGPRVKRHHQWLCKCACGTTKLIYGTNLRHRQTKSCGCLLSEMASEWGKSRFITHGKYKTSEYWTWLSMINRCTCETNKEFHNYGGRGIKVCDRWRHSFENFLVDMGPRPSPKHSIDRFPDNDGNYEPGNCRWATMAEQNRNTRRNHLLTFNKKTATVAEWAEITGISSRTIRSRVRIGWSDEQAVTIPARVTPT